METYKHKVQYYETDKMGVTHHSNYIRFMEEARIDFMEKINCPYDQMEADGVGSPVMEIECKYKRPTSYPDIIEIEVKVAEMTDLKLKLSYTQKVDSRVVCTGSSLHCFLNAEGRPVKYQEKYPELAAALKEMQ